MSISVNTTGSKVTLSGSVTSAENLGKAIKLAADTEGVNEVISTLQVKK
jgi:osmotically-inducible protein OsmY